MSKLILGSIDLTPIIKARDFLTNALEEAESDLEKTGAIKAFEFCYELAWKTCQKVLNLQGKEVNSPRETFRWAAQWGLIRDPEIWFNFGKERNLTVHTYEEEVLHSIFSDLSNFLYELNLLITGLEKLK